jgi:hypothetical protein
MFDLTTNVTTREGRPARIVTTALDDETYPVGALVQNEDGTEEFETYTSGGLYHYELEGHSKDLVKVPETMTSYVNLGYGMPTYTTAAHKYPAFPVVKVIRERASGRLVSSEIATA